MEKLEKSSRWKCVIVATLAIFAVCISLYSHRTAIAGTSSLSQASHETLDQALSQSPVPSLTLDSATSERAVWPYSVLPGGVRSGTELQDALSRDSVAAAHYAGFNAKSTRVIRLASDRQAYVSYRLGNRIYWTAHKVTLHAGETLLSDGKNLARTRCGNRLSESPASPTHPAEPPASVMNAPIVPRFPELAMQPSAGDPVWSDIPFTVASFSNGPMLDTSPSPNGNPVFPYSPPFSTFVPPNLGSGPVGSVVPPAGPPEGTPEPASWQILLAGLSGIALFLKLRRA
jgi:hypothetical protein